MKWRRAEGVTRPPEPEFINKVAASNEDLASAAAVYNGSAGVGAV